VAHPVHTILYAFHCRCSCVLVVLFSYFYLHLQKKFLNGKAIFVVPSYCCEKAHVADFHVCNIFNAILAATLKKIKQKTRAVLTGKHGTLVRRAPGWQGAPTTRRQKLVVIKNVYFTWQKL